MDEILGIGVVILMMLSLALGITGLYRAVHPYARGRYGAAGELLVSLVGFVLLGVIVVLQIESNSPREAARRAQCANNLKAIMLAMQCYHDQYGCLPPAYTVDKAGRPLHSWRVLLLPYGCFGWAGIYEDIRFDEPFDSQHNRTIFQAAESDGMPYVFRCPSDHENRTDTNYVMLVGPHTISNGSNSVRLKDVTDGDSKTMAIVETYGLGIRWYEPRDLRIDEVSFKINDPDYYSIASRHPGGANVGLADGSVRFLSDDTDPRTIEAVTTIHGGEDVSGLLK